MSNTKTKTVFGEKPMADVTKDLEVLVSANRKTLQDAFLSGTDAAENAFKTSREAFKTNYEKVLKDGKEQISQATKTLGENKFYDNESAESLLKAGSAAVEKTETLGAEIVDFSTSQVADYFAAARSVLAADDVQKAVELQTTYARSSVEGYVTEVSKLNTMIFDATKTMFEPFGASFAANMEKFTKSA
ncbi:MAG: phasin family protein [Sneathiella sp.]